MPYLVRAYIRHCLIGFAVAALFVAGLIWGDVVGLGHLVRHSAGGTLAIAMLFIFNGLVFAGVQFAIYIMGLPQEDGGGGKRAPEPIRAPALVPVRSSE